jgi:hypothetical protein
MSDNSVSPGQAARRTVAIVPHTHWDRECSGEASACGCVTVLDLDLPF